MHAVTIWDRIEINGGSVLGVDLVHVLELVLNDLQDSTWIIEDVEAIGPSLPRLLEASDSGRSIPGNELLSIASDLDQVSCGEFHGAIAGSLWLYVKAIRGTEYVVVTSDQPLIAALRERFSDVRDSPQDAAFYSS